MTFFSVNVNIRELRSFRLLNRTENFKRRMIKEKSSTLYAMCDSLSPKERVEMRERYIFEQKLNLLFLPKRVSQNLLRGEEWKSIRYLVQGNVVEIFNASGGDLTEDQLRFIMNSGKFSVRFLVWRNQIYRSQHIRDFFMEPDYRRIGAKLPAVQLAQILQSVTLTSLLVGRGNSVK